MFSSVNPEICRISILCMGVCSCVHAIVYWCSVFARAEQSAYISVFAYPKSSEQRLLAAQIKTSVISFSLTMCVCACVCVCVLCVSVFAFLSARVRVCVYFCVHRRSSMHVVPSCLLAWPATFSSKYIFSTLVFFFLLSSFYSSTPPSLHFGVLLDRTTLAAGNSPLSTLHPKACGFWKPVCVWVGTHSCCVYQ